MKTNPFISSKSFGDAIETLFNTTISDLIGPDISFSQPNVNVVESDTQYTIELAAPGMTKKDFVIEVKEDTLKVSRKVEEVKEAEGENESVGEKVAYKRREFNYQNFERSFNLPKTANKDAIHAKYQNGILYLSIDKKEEAIDKGPKTIKIL